MINNKKDRALVLLNRLWREVESGTYGQFARITPEWSRDKKGYWNFKQWFDKQPVVRRPIITKDFLVTSDTFSPETCVLVPGLLHEWIVRNFIVTRPIPKDQTDPFWVSMTLGNERTTLKFCDEESAKNFVRENAERFFSTFELEMTRTVPNFMARMREFTEIALTNNPPFRYYTRVGKRKFCIRAERLTTPIRKAEL